MNHPIRYRLEWLVLLAMRALARALPERMSGHVGALTGRLVGSTWRRRRTIARTNLCCAYPDWSADQVGLVAGRVFENFGRTTFEILRITSSTPSRLASIIHAPPELPLERARQEGRGALLISGHIGNWELFGGWIHSLGYPLDVVVKPMRNPLSDSLYNARRADLGLGIIHTQTATRGIVEALRKGRFVAILADQYAGEDGVEVEFFGKKVSTPRGPAVLALKFGCPILSGVLARRSDGEFDAIIDPPLEFVPSGDNEADVVALTQAFTSRLERHIRNYPDQWLWTHRRWRWYGANPG